MSASSSKTSAPERSGGAYVWPFRHEEWRLRFYGRGVDGVADSVEPELPRAWLRQVHGDGVVAARPGLCGEGDALLVRSEGLVASIATADCVPIALLGAREAALVHAGWRGIVGGVVTAAAACLGGRNGITALIGPAIGPCCYEVGDEVARAVAAAAGSDRCLRPQSSGRLHLDLQEAVRSQLAAVASLESIAEVDVCTRCHPQWLWSYRREGPKAGRNWALLWRRGADRPLQSG